MRWFVDKRVDTGDEFRERVKFYESLAQKDMYITDGTLGCFEFWDGNSDNRCMIIGHTDTAGAVIGALWAENKKKYKFYLSVCEMRPNLFEDWLKFKKMDCAIYLTPQDPITIRGQNTRSVEFLEKSHTGLAFRATQSELNMYNSPYKGFFNKLEASFVKRK